MTELFISALITFFVAIDPPGCAAIYASMTTEATPAQRRVMAFRAIFVSAIILLIFGFFGEALLTAIGVNNRQKWNQLIHDGKGICNILVLSNR